MEKSKRELPRPVLIILILAVLILAIYFRFINPEILSKLISNIFAQSPFLFITILLISIPIFIYTSLWLIRYGKKQGGFHGKLFPALMTLRLGITSIFLVLLILLFILFSFQVIQQNLICK